MHNARQTPPTAGPAPQTPRVDQAGAAAVSARALAILALLLLLPNLAVFAVRLGANLDHGEFFEATGTERVPIYGIWKAQNGHPVYENPFADNFALSMYNFGFYYAYAAVANTAGWQNERLVTGARLVTAAWSLAGAAAMVYLLSATMRERLRGWRLVLAVAGSGATWLSSMAIGWWGISARPDMASAFWALAGLGVFVTAVNRNSCTAAFAASMLFYVAWCFKQSTIAIFAGTLMAAFLGGRVALGLSLLWPFALSSAATLMVGGDMYRFNILTVPTITRFTGWQRQWQYVLKVFAPNPHVVLLPLLAAASLLARRERWRLPRARQPETILPIVVVATLAWCGLGIAREGGDRNTLLELYLSAAAMTLLLVLTGNRAVFETRLRRLACAAAVGVAALVPTAQLVAFDRIGDLNFGTREEVDAARAIARVLQGQAKPVFAEQHVFALPWYSTGGQYPALVLDDYYYNTWPARQRMRAAGGLESLITSGRFPTLLMTGQFRLAEAAAAEYERSEEIRPTRPWNLSLMTRRTAAPAETQSKVTPSRHRSDPYVP